MSCNMCVPIVLSSSCWKELRKIATARGCSLSELIEDELECFLLSDRSVDIDEEKLEEKLNYFEQ